MHASRGTSGVGKDSWGQAMTSHDIVKQLRILRSTPGKQGTYARLADSSDDLLLSVAEAFQPGDAERLDYAARYLDSTNCPAQCIDAVRRLQVAAERLENKP